MVHFLIWMALPMAFMVNAATDVIIGDSGSSAMHNTAFRASLKLKHVPGMDVMTPFDTKSISNDIPLPPNDPVGAHAPGIVLLAIALLFTFDSNGNSPLSRAMLGVVLLQSLMLWQCTSGETQCAAARDNTCCLYDGDVQCWGQGDYGILGTGSTEDIYEPSSSMIDLGTGFVARQITCGVDHCCAVSTVDSSKCWGRNNYGQLGQGHTDSIGDDAYEMGDYLSPIDWGTDFAVSEISTGGYHTCAIDLESHEIRCCGWNSAGQLGQGNTTNIGDDVGEMGDSMEPTSLGSVTPITVSCGSMHSCAMLQSGGIKCWGKGESGQLGTGDMLSRGDDADEMGDNLYIVDLGTGFNVMQLSCGGYHTCAVSTNLELKCWGKNSFGELGLGDTTNRGNYGGQMGNSLPVVQLGSDFSLKLVAAASYHTMVLSTNGDMKAFGRNDWAQLGYGDTTDRGDLSGQMGDSLPLIELGNGFRVSGITEGEANSHSCAFDGHFDALSALKCWGRNDNGELGLGDTEYRGDATGEMGDDLEFVNVTFTASPTETNSAVSRALSLHFVFWFIFYILDVVFGSIPQ